MRGRTESLGPVRICRMKTMVDIPDAELSDAVRFTQAKTAPEAVKIAIVDFNRRQRIRELVADAGTCPDMITVDELREQRHS